MNRNALLERFRSVAAEDIPLPGKGQTAVRHCRLMEVGREELSLARLAEAHWDAIAILAEADRKPEPGALYGVWASEIPGQAVTFTENNGSLILSGTKMFCSGGGLIDRALVTAGTTDHRLIDVDLRSAIGTVIVDDSAWKTRAFFETKTSKVTFDGTKCSTADIVGPSHWYLNRPGFWHGACGPAACWAGGALGLVDYAKTQSRNDAHTMAHLGAMSASAWALRSFVESSGHEIDASPFDVVKARIRARTVRHLVEQASTDILRRLSRAYGPHPLAMNESISLRYQELDIYLRQSHAERDLEALGADVSFRHDR